MNAAADDAWMAWSEPGSSEKTFVQFNRQPKQNAEKSLAEGRPIFDDLEYIRIMGAGDKTNISHRPVTLQDRQQFAQQYAAWKAGTTQALEGTPLSEWPAVSRGEVAELAHFHVRTIEALAAVSDATISGIGPIRALRQKARDFIAAAKGEAPLLQVRAENDELRAQLADVQRQHAELAKVVDEMKRSKRKD